MIGFDRSSQQEIHPLPTSLLPKVPAPIDVGTSRLHMEHPILSVRAPPRHSATEHTKLPQTRGVSLNPHPNPSFIISLRFPNASTLGPSGILILQTPGQGKAPPVQCDNPWKVRLNSLPGGIMAINPCSPGVSAWIQQHHPLALAVSIVSLSLCSHGAGDHLARQLLSG